MHIIDIAIRNKIAVNTHQKEYICGNDDFVVMFDFDAEWDAFVHKTARFISNGKYVDVVFNGNECQLPIHSGTNTIMCGVYAGDLRTTTPALIGARKSILCGSTAPAEPRPDVYAQMVALFNAGLDESRVNANRAEDAKAAAEEAQRKAESAQSTSETIAKGVAQAKSDALAAQSAAAQSAKEAKEAASKAGGVKTVNGKSPDENGNVEVEGVTDYNKLENKPVGVEIGELLPEMTVEIDPENGGAEFAATVPLVAGETYTVKWNGVDYECICSLIPAQFPTYGLGNIGAITGGNDTGEPFVFLSLPNMGACGIFALDGSASATLTIIGEVVKKLDTKLLPKIVVTFTRLTFGDEAGTSAYLFSDKPVEQIVAAINEGMIVEGRLIENGTIFMFHVAKAPVSVESVENLDEDCLVFSSVYGVTPTIIAYKRLSGNLEVFEIDHVTP